MNRLLAEANRLLYTPVPEYLPRQTKTPRYSGDELERDLDIMVNSAFRLALAYQMTGEKKICGEGF